MIFERVRSVSGQILYLPVYTIKFEFTLSIFLFSGEGPPSLPSRGEVSTDNINKLPFAIGLIVVFILIVLNVAVVIFCMVKRSRSKYKGKLQ